MTAILGIDAAWTETEPSGVALMTEYDSCWRCVGLAPSYDTFIALATGKPVDWSARRIAGTAPDPAALLAAAQTLLADEKVDVVAVDMPLALTLIGGRRAADDQVARAFGAYGCSPHSPNPVRPGKIGQQLQEGFAACGFQLMTATTASGSLPALIEVYPHPALVALLSAPYRIPYKVGRSKRYWPSASPATRREALLTQFACIHTALAGEIVNIDLVLPDPGDVPTLAGLKRYEDALDALVCAWIGTKYLAIGVASSTWHSMAAGRDRDGGSGSGTNVRCSWTEILNVPGPIVRLPPASVKKWLNLTIG